MAQGRHGILVNAFYRDVFPPLSPAVYMRACRWCTLAFVESQPSYPHDCSILPGIQTNAVPAAALKDGYAP